MLKHVINEQEGVYPLGPPIAVHLHPLSHAHFFFLYSFLAASLPIPACLPLPSSLPLLPLSGRPQCDPSRVSSERASERSPLCSSSLPSFLPSFLRHSFGCFLFSKFRRPPPPPSTSRSLAHSLLIRSRQSVLLFRSLTEKAVVGVSQAERGK